MVKIRKDSTLQEDAQAIIEQFAKDNPERVEKYGMPQFVPGTTEVKPWGEWIPEKIEKLKKLEELFEYTYEIKDVTGNMADIIRGLPQHVINEIIRLLELYKRNLIEDSFKAYPMNVDALNNRNGSVTVIWELIRFISWFRHKIQDMEYRDSGDLRQKLEEANKKVNENPLDSIK